MTESEVLVREGTTVDRLAASAVAAGEVTTLGHEARDDAVELGALKVERLAARCALALLTLRDVSKWSTTEGRTGAEGAEVLSGPGDDVGEELPLVVSD